MTIEQELNPHDDWFEFLAAANEFRPELHRYCTRLMGSVIEGEDVVQDTLVSAFVSLPKFAVMPSLRPWLFRIAHNRALDLLRANRLRWFEPLENALDVMDLNNRDPLDALMNQEAIALSISRFMELPIAQRSVVILKDVLGESLIDIATLLDTSIDSVKSHLARGRVQLHRKSLNTIPLIKQDIASPAVARYVELFNQRNWNELRALLSADVKLKQSSHPLRIGAEDVGLFFTIYAKCDFILLVPAWLDGKEVIAVYPEKSAVNPSHVMWLEWFDGHISFIHDYRYVDYLLKEAELEFEQ